MPKSSNRSQYWIGLVEQHFRLGNQFALVPVASFSQETAMALANHLDVVLEKWGSDYFFRQKIKVESKEASGEVRH